MREPTLTQILNPTIHGLEENIPSMITFLDSPIDQQPWERTSQAVVLSNEDPAIEINLMSLMRDMMGHVSVPALFGRAFMENFPNVLQDLYTMDYGLNWFLMGVPRWLPIPPATRAHLARRRVRQAVAAFHTAYDAVTNGKGDPAWGDMDDVSQALKMRNAIYRDNNFAPADREDISILWAMVVNANLLVYWHLLYILATPGLVDQLRKEIEPFARVHKPETIHGISEAPRLEISHEGLSKKCPLFRSTYMEALRISSQPWSIRKIAKDVIITEDRRGSANAVSYALKTGEYVTMPHDLHMRDPHYFKDPHDFIPERFLVKAEDGSLSAEPGTTRPYGGGPSMCKGRIFAERECLSLVAGVLACWDIEPANGKAWKIPDQRKTTAVALPVEDTRVKIKRRDFDCV